MKNPILFLADDLGRRDLQCFGLLDTPLCLPSAEGQDWICEGGMRVSLIPHTTEPAANLKNSLFQR